MLHQLVVNLTQSNYEAMHKAANRREDTLTDTVNRALAVYETITALEADGGVIHVQMPSGTNLRLLII